MEEELDRIVDETLTRFGRIDVLVNAAAYSCWSPMLDGEQLFDSFHMQFDLNAYVPLRLSALVAERYWQNNSKDNKRFNRSVVNISSTAGVYIYRGLGQSVYSASKAALNFLTKHAADELGVIGVRANAVAPTSFPDLVSIESVAEGIRTLIENRATGSILVIDVNGESWL